MFVYLKSFTVYSKLEFRLLSFFFPILSALPVIIKFVLKL